jgi:diguanylate cyclase (GGDEF)-like protein
LANPFEPEGPGQLTLHGQDGVELGTLAWQLDLPGQALMRQVMPAMTLALVGIAFMALLAAHRSRATVRLLHKARVQVTHDYLTGLPNRVLLEEPIAAAVRQSLRDWHDAAVLYLDLDGFKNVNDTLGHEGGDLLLVQVARRLRSLVRDADTVARISGDEFAVVQSKVERPEAAMHLCNRLVHALTEPFVVDGCEIRIGASVRVALAPRDATDPVQLLRLAD